MDSIGMAILRAFGPPDGEGYGLQVIDRVLRDSDGRLVLHQGNLYPRFRELERQGLLRSWDGEVTPERRGRPRRYYALTADGWDVLRPLRQVIDPKSPNPVGRAPVLVLGAVVRMQPPSRLVPRLKPMPVNVVPITLFRRRKVAQ